MKETFPILGGYGAIPLEVIAPHEEQAKKNHCGQTLKRLAERGGLSYEEILAVLEDREWSRDNLADIKVAAIIREFYGR